MREEAPGKAPQKSSFERKVGLVVASSVQKVIRGSNASFWVDKVAAQMHSIARTDLQQVPSMPDIQNSPTPAPKSSKMALARILMLAALAVHLLSLFLPYRDSENQGSTVYLESWHVAGIQGVSKELTGFQEKPYAVYVIVGLLVLFGTDLYKEPIGKRFVYWGSFMLLVYFAFGGAPLRTSGGKLSMLCLFVVLVAAFLNELGCRRREV